MPAPSQARRAAGPGGTSGVAGKTLSSDAIGLYRARDAQLQAKDAKARVPRHQPGTKCRNGHSPPPATVRSTTIITTQE